jgi:hypothetical protein
MATATYREPVRAPRIPAVNPNPRTLGTLWILYGLLRLVVAAVMVINWGVATVMFGALLVRVRDDIFWMSVFHFAYAVAIVITILAGIFGLLGGAALVTGRSSARTLSLTASFFSVSDLPVGTTLGIYTLIAFLGTRNSD